MKRNTIQKSLILDAVLSMSNHPTADEVYEAVSTRYPNISKGTVYRNLNSLADNGDILRVSIANAPDRYDKTCGKHVHFFCLKCGCVYDFNFNNTIDIDSSLNPGFEIVDYEFIVKGYCKECKQYKEVEDGQQGTI